MQWYDCLFDILTQQRLIDDKWRVVFDVYKTRKFKIVYLMFSWEVEF